MPDGRVRAAVVGAGRFGREHARVLAADPAVELVAIVDPVVDRARLLAAETGAQRAHADLAVILRDEDPDLVSIVVPVRHRGTLVDVARAAGARVLVEKPLAHDPEEAMRLAGLRDDGGAPEGQLLVGHVVRFADTFAAAHAEAQGGAYGAVRSAVSWRRRPASHLTDFPQDDPVWLTLVHDIDLARWMTGSEVVAVSAEGRRDASGRLVRCDAHLRLASGAEWTAIADWTGQEGVVDDGVRAELADGRLEAVVHTDAASLLVEGNGEEGRRDVHPPADLQYGSALERELRHVVGVTATGAASEILRTRDAVAVVAVAAAVDRSLEEGGSSHDIV